MGLARRSCFAMGLLLPMAAWAQTDTAGRVSSEADRALQAAPGSRAKRSDTAAPRLQPLRAPSDALSDSSGAARVDVVRFVVEGSTAFDAKAFDAELAPLAGPALAFADLARAADAVAEMYRRRGLLALAYLPRQTIRDGVVQIEVQESRVAAVDVSRGDGVRLRNELALSLLRRHVREGDLVDVDAIERAMLALNGLPGVHASTELTSGELGATDLRLRLDEDRRWSGQLGTSNHGSRSLGRALADARVDLNDALGWGERFSLGLLSSGAPLTLVRLGAIVPVHTSGTLLGANTTWLRFEDRNTSSSAAVLPSGSSRSSTIELSQPLARRRAGAWWVTLGAETRALRDRSVNGADRDLQLWRLGVNGSIDSDETSTAASLEWRSGRAKLLNPADQAQDEGTPAQPGAQVAGRFDKLVAGLSHLRGISAGWNVWASLRAQAALRRNLEDSEKLAAGGADGVRGYPTGEAPSDTLTLATIELRRSLPMTGALWEASAFIDSAWLQRWKETMPLGNNPDGPIPNGYRLSAAGVGLSVAGANGLQLRLTLARPFGGNPGRNAEGLNADGARDGWRAWCQLLWQL